MDMPPDMPPNMSQIVVTDEWADWPAPSPTSSFKINVRFYTAVYGDGSSLRLDLGAEDEALLEGVYVTLDLPKKVPPVSPVDYELFIRNVYQTKLASMLPYITQLARYAVLTGDTKEVSRAVDAERRSVISTLRLLPFRILPTLLPRPTDWNERLRFYAKYLWTRVRLTFPL